MEKSCSKCQTPFTCSCTTQGCWCEDHQLSSATLEHLRASYRDCLCPACLASFAVGSSSDNTSLQNESYDHNSR